ncbi:DUF6221 family protein [Nonomuraea sp. NPDC059023]|uniref:DUF6221 family protein n=1 Tax=unclassified Nonomuraea TaxID=2593643 RepID=UPI0036864DD1
MDDLITFLRARLDEDEQAARDASADVWRKSERPSIWVSCEDGPVAQTKYFEDAAHIARHDPARVLREVEAKRRMLDLHARDHACVEHVRAGGDSAPGTMIYANDWWVEYPGPPCLVVRLLALPYSYDADYKAEWKP